MAMSEAKKRANKKWNDENLKERYDRIQVVVPKGKKEHIQLAAKASGESTNAYINKAIDILMGGGGFGFNSGNEEENMISPSVSHAALFSETELEKITALLQDGQTIGDYIKAAVLEKIRN